MHQDTTNPVPTPASARAQLLGKGISELRDAKRVTTIELAEMLGIDQVIVERWEAGDASLTFEDALAIEEALDADRGCLGADGRYFGYSAVPASNEALVFSEDFDSSVEALKAVTAAAVLGLGVRLRNYMHAIDTSRDGVVTSEERWVVDLLGGAPEDDVDLG